MRFSSGITLPALPRKPEEIITWAAGLHKAMHTLISQIMGRLNDMIIEGEDASKPAASGSRRFYFATDTSKMYYDAGAWVVLN